MAPLDSRQLRAFQELARQQSFTAAAQVLNLTQSAVSHSIKALESALDVQLFERQGKAVTLSDAGEVLLPHVDDIFVSMQRAQADLAQLQQPGHGRLRIGATIALSQFVLPLVLRELKGAFPGFEITVTTEDTRQLLDLLDRDEIDLVFGMQIPELDHYEFRPLFSDRIEMAVAPEHSLAKEGDLGMAPSAARLAEENFIFYHRDSETFRLLERSVGGIKGRMHEFLKVGSMAAIKEMARIGTGIGLMAAWIAIDELKAGTLVIRPLPWKTAARHWGVYTRAQRGEETIDNAFFGFCRTVVEGMQLEAETIRTSQGAASG